MVFVIDREVKDREVLKVVENDHIELKQKVADLANVILVSNTGTITIRKNMDGDARLTAIAQSHILFTGEFNSDTVTKLVSKEGNITLEGEGHSQKNINSQAGVSIAARNNVFLRGDLNSNANVSISSKRGTVEINGDINSNARLSVIAEADITLIGDINSQTNIEFISTRGSIAISGHIHSEAIVQLTAARTIAIKNEVKGNLSLRARSGEDIRILGSISDNAYVALKANTGVVVSGDISGGARVNLATASNSIELTASVSGNALVRYWPSSSLVIDDPANNYIRAEDWSGTPIPETGPRVNGTWWTNWFWSYGFVSDQIRKPINYRDLRENVANVPDGHRIKAIGGGWSFSDIGLPLDASQLETIVLYQRSRNDTADLRRVLRHMNAKDTPMDLYTDQLAKSLDHGTEYNQRQLRNDIRSGIDLTGISSNSVMIDIRNLRSSLQHQIDKAPYEDAEGNRVHLFWVEGGITMTDLNKLLDHQSPRLAIQASGGSPGATLAGTLSTATHGGEFQDPLLVDRVKAIHLIGYKGEHWWIEGDEVPVMEESEIKRLYGADIHIVNSASVLPEGLTAEDFLKTVVVSMGTLGIICSVVLEVVEQFSIRQITKKFKDWETLLGQIGISKAQLSSSDNAANEAMYQFLMDGALNGTGIPLRENRYVDLAVSPLNQGCWIINRKFIEGVARDSKNAGDLMGNYLSSVTQAMREGAEKGAIGGQLGGRILDFLGLPRDMPGLIALGLHEPSVFTKTLDGMFRSPMILSSILAHLQAKAIWNATDSRDPARSTEFMADTLEGVLDALQATSEEPISDFTGLSFDVGAIGWPDGGIPGRGFEVALPPHRAFSYMQGLMDVIARYTTEKKIFLGYISTRICPQTKTMLGMQQFERSVMVEVVAHRTPQSNEVFDAIIDLTKNFNLREAPMVMTHVAPRSAGLYPIFHWGLETERYDRAYLESTPFGLPYKSGSSLTRLDVFKLVKAHIQGGNPPVFQNSFMDRMGL